MFAGFAVADNLDQQQDKTGLLYLTTRLALSIHTTALMYDIRSLPAFHLLPSVSAFLSLPITWPHKATLTSRTRRVVTSPPSILHHGQRTRTAHTHRILSACLPPACWNIRDRPLVTLTERRGLHHHRQASTFRNRLRHRTCYTLTLSSSLVALALRRHLLSPRARSQRYPPFVLRSSSHAARAFVSSISVIPVAATIPLHRS